jgi:hypothetical protein
MLREKGNLDAICTSDICESRERQHDFATCYEKKDIWMQYVNVRYLREEREKREEVRRDFRLGSFGE